MFSYIDPGTGSMLFTVLIGVLGAAVYSIRVFIMKLRSRVGGGKVKKTARVPLAIFSDNKRYFATFDPILRELSARGQSVLYLTASEDDPALECKYEGFTAEYIGPGNRVYTRLNSLDAAVLFSTTPGLDVYQWKRSPKVSCYVHIPHAPADVTRYRMFGIDYYDAILLSGEYQIKQIRDLEALRNLPEKETVLVGIPYMDDMAARYEKVGPAAPHPRTVLLAPSWGKSAIFGVYGGKIIEDLLATGYHVIVRPHPQSFQSEPEVIDELMKKYPESDNLEWNRDLENFDVLNRSDILVSDFSGVTFDFAFIFDKPIIYTNPDFDRSPYDAWWLEEDLWTERALPRLGELLTPENESDLKGLIDRCLEDPRYAEGRREMKEQTWVFPSEGGRRAAEYLIGKVAEITKEEAAE